MVYLPVSAEESAPGEQEPLDPSGRRGSGTILLVEDDAQVRNLARTLLDRLGYTVLATGGGREALSTLDAHGGPIHLLLTDVIMPDMNGRELYTLAAQRRPGLKVLYMSGYTGNVIAHQGVLEEGTHFVQKPFSLRSLAARLREALEG